MFLQTNRNSVHTSEVPIIILHGDLYTNETKWRKEKQILSQKKEIAVNANIPDLSYTKSYLRK